MYRYIPLFLTACFVISCSQKKQVELIIYNANIYTVDSLFSRVEAMVINEGKIVALGSSDSLMKQFEAKTTINAEKKFIYPGFIDAHTHFFRYGMGLQKADLVNTGSWNEILEKLKIFSATNPEGWLIGRGWDQNDWPVQSFPSKEGLDSLFPDRPVLLTRVDGHAAIANQRALDLGGVTEGMKLAGGEIETRKGRLTGILIDNAVRLVSARIPSPSAGQVKEALFNAERNCFAVGLTTVDDCGLDYHEAMAIDSLQKSGDLSIRVYVMLSDAPENYTEIFNKGKYKTARMNIRAFKVYADGALGSRGACLLEPYNDKPSTNGFLLNRTEHFDSVAAVILAHGFQMCTHAIGESANRTILRIYGKYLKGANNLRWRIEHAQVINPEDLPAFGNYRVVPSVQPTHATSDMYWASVRLGNKRVKTAYAYKDLLNENGWLPLGTDFPVEDINPLKTFFAAVVRKDAKGWPNGGFQMENALSRQEALKGMTIWAAKSNFEEHEKGSLEPGKLADFVLLGSDLMSFPEANLSKISVLGTFLNGVKVYENKTVH